MVGGLYRQRWAMCLFYGLIRGGWDFSYLRVSYTMALLRIMLRIILSRPCYNYYLSEDIRLPWPICCILERKA